MSKQYIVEADKFPGMGWDITSLGGGHSLRIDKVPAGAELHISGSIITLGRGGLSYLASAAVALVTTHDPEALPTTDDFQPKDPAPENLDARLKALIELIGGRSDYQKSTEELLKTLERGLSGYFREDGKGLRGIPFIEEMLRKTDDIDKRVRSLEMDRSQQSISEHFQHKSVMAITDGLKSIVKELSDD